MKNVNVSEILKGSGLTARKLRERDRNEELCTHEVTTNDRQIIVYTRNWNASRFLSSLELGNQRSRVFQNLADKAHRLNSYAIKDGNKREVIVSLIAGSDVNKTELTII